MASDASDPPIAPRWSQIPEHFYKYRPVTGQGLERLLVTIERREVYWPAPVQFNDPFDCAPKYLAPTGNVKKQVVERVVNNFDIGRNRAERRNARRELRRISKAEMEANFEIGMAEILEMSAVYSLSTDPHNILMWSHYADSHSGVCLRIKGKPLFEQFMTGHWVTYEEERPKVRIGQESEASLLRKILFTKAKDWHYEGEWRMVQYKGRRGVRQLNPGIIDGVILGSRSSEATKQAVANAIERSGLAIELMQAVEDRDEYGLTIECIDNA